MRIIIDIEGDGSGQPDIVLRSSSPQQGTTEGMSRSPITTTAGAVDAGPAPTGGEGAQAIGAVTTPPTSASTVDTTGSNSAGGAPSLGAGG